MITRPAFLLLFFGLLCFVTLYSFRRASPGLVVSKSHIAVMPRPKVLIVGGGLAGFSAALHCAAAANQEGIEVDIVILEKTAKVGGNSAKASSGINGLNPPVGDTVDLFQKDTVSSGGGLSKEELVAALVNNSLKAIEYLESLGLNLTRVTKLGGHSVPRSRSNPAGPNVGLAIMQAVIATARETGSISILENAKVLKLLTSGNTIAGVVCQTDEGEKNIPADAVIFATGGFAANKQLLQEHNPVAAELATTNGPWATGDALAMATEVGAALTQLDQVQIHPTGLVDPKDPDAGTKWLAPERLRGCGGLLLNLQGQRFVDELQRRDHVSDAMMKQTKRQAYLLLAAAAAQEYGTGSLDFYSSKGMMQKVTGVVAAAAAMGVSADLLRAELEQYNADREAGKDKFGRTSFGHPVDLEGVMYFGIVTPVVHYTMGGLEIDVKSQVLDTHGKPIPGLYAAGEASGGLHGRNRLGGNSLLECAVFGKISGVEALHYVKSQAQLKEKASQL